MVKFKEGTNAPHDPLLNNFVAIASQTLLTYFLYVSMYIIVDESVVAISSSISKMFCLSFWCFYIDFFLY